MKKVGGMGSGLSGLSGLSAIAGAVAWTPASPTSDGGDTPTLWLYGRGIEQLYQDAAKTTPVTANGQGVKAWDDLSASNNDAIEATNNPTYDDATYVQPGVRFNGTSQFMELVTALVDSKGTLIITMAFDAELTGVRDLFCIDDDTTPAQYFVVGVRDGAYGVSPLDVTYLFSRQASRGSQGDDDISHATPHILTWATDGTNTIKIVRVDGTNQVETWGATIWSGQWFDDVGGPQSTYIACRSEQTAKSNYFDGIIFEIIYYNTNLSVADIQQVEKYAANPLGISLPF